MMDDDVATITTALANLASRAQDWLKLMPIATELAKALERAGVDVSQYSPLPDQMNIVVPYAGGQWLPVVMATLEAEGITAKYLHVGGDPEAYWSALVGLWRVGETFIVVEHDVLPWPGALAQMWRCPEPWCAVPYQLNGSMLPGNGCTKFSAELMKALPDAWVEVASRTWLTLDTCFGEVAARHGHSVHRHGPPAIHLNENHIADPERNWIVALLSEGVAYTESVKAVSVDGR